MIPFARAVHDRSHRKVVMVMFAQGGKSDTLLDIIGARFAQNPVPTLYLGPTKQFLTDQWEPRIQDLIDEAPSLRSIVTKGKRWKLLKKLLAGVPLRLGHGGSSAALKSDPFGLVLTDEADELMANVRGAGDPIRLADRRGDSYADFVHAIVSTPSEGPSDIEVDKNSGLTFWAPIDAVEISSTIWRLWQSGSRYHWAWPCPHCGEYFIPRFKELRWDKPMGAKGREQKSDPVLAKNTAHLVCPRCGGVIENRHKKAMNAGGVYVAPGQWVEQGGVVRGDVPEHVTLSFWVSGLASPFKSFGDRAAEYVEAALSRDMFVLKAVVNGSFGELFAPGSGEVPDWRELERLKSPATPYQLGEVLSWTRFLTMAVDVQKDRLIYGIRAWGPRAISSLVMTDEIWGRTEEEDVWEALEDIVLGKIAGFPIGLTLIDSGFRPGNPKQVPENRVYSFCQRHPRLVRPTKGRDTLAGMPLQPKKIEATVNWRGKLEVVGLELFHINTDFFKSWVHERLRWPVDEPGAFLLPEDVSDDYLQLLVSEARVRKAGGKAQWVRRARDNHYFDIEAMQAAAGWYLGAQRIPDTAQDEARIQKLKKLGLDPGKKRLSMADYSAALNGATK